MIKAQEMTARRKPTNFADVHYTPIEGINGDDFTDAQFRITASPVPYKAISLAIFLCVTGLALLVVGSCIVSGLIDSKYQDRMWPVIILGCLMFIPGAYHVRIAFYAFNKISGYSFENIPEFE